MRLPAFIAISLGLCGCPVIDGDLADQKTQEPVVDTAALVIDNDGDGFGEEMDCDDTNAAVNPSAYEICDGIDNNCDGEVDEATAIDAPTWYPDSDGDGFGLDTEGSVACNAPTGHVTDNTDCDDTDSERAPGETEVCDGVDNDCDGDVDIDTANCTNYYTDEDGDGFGTGNPVCSCESNSGGSATESGDCNDSDAAVHPGAYENCTTSQDDNCDGEPNEENAIGCTEFYYDTDSDGAGTSSHHCFCEPRDGFSALAPDDCNDAEPTIYSGATEVCDGQRNDCDGGTSVPGDEVDDDGDAHVECTLDPSGWDGDSAVTGGDDCDDSDATVHPAASEICDGQDNDCNNGWPWAEYDGDGDGWVECTVDSGGWDGTGSVYGGDDCDSSDGTIYPGAPEICDGLVNTCGGTLPSNEVDDDADGYVECTIHSGGWDGTGSVYGGDDCDDSDPSMATYSDFDCDGSLTVDDCDDTDPDIFSWDRDGDGIDEGCGWTVDLTETHACGLDSYGSLACWGSDTSGQLSSAPTGIFLSVKACFNHTCAVKTDQSVECWGNDSSGESTPPPGSFQSVGVGYQHSCGHKIDGSIECWGDDADGHVSQVPTGTFSSLSTGKAHNCAIRSSGSIECWGSYTDGLSTPPGMSAPPSGTFQSVSVGDLLSCGVKTDGTLECWGRDDYGAVSNTPTGTFQSVNPSDYHSCGVKTDGTLECWGRDTHGQATPPSGTFQSVSAGGNDTCGVRTDGTLDCWGYNDYGELSHP